MLKRNYPCNVSMESDPIDVDSGSVGENLVPNTAHRVYGAVKVLGNLTHKSNEHIINTIMRQADRHGLIDSLGFPNRMNWLKDNLI